jgi:predicted RNA methylase
MIGKIAEVSHQTSLAYSPYTISSMTITRIIHNTVAGVGYLTLTSLTIGAVGVYCVKRQLPNFESMTPNVDVKFSAPGVDYSSADLPDTEDKWFNMEYDVTWK